MATSISSSSGPPIRQQDEAVTRAIQTMFDNYNKGKLASQRSAGMGCMVLARATSSETVHTRLYEQKEQRMVASSWNSVKAAFGYKQDHASLYFHLHGVLFMVVPHLPPGSTGTLELQLNCTNDLMNPTVAKREIDLTKGPQAVYMAPDFTLPFTIDDLYFYYSLCIRETSATIPCSVLAFWRQSVDRKTACYEPQRTQDWMVKRLASPGMLRSKEHAQALIAAGYGSQEPVPRSLFVPDGSQMRIEQEVVGGSENKLQRIGNAPSAQPVLSGTALAALRERSSSMRVQAHWNGEQDNPTPSRTSFDMMAQPTIKNKPVAFFSGMTAQVDIPMVAQTDTPVVAANVVHQDVSAGSAFRVEGASFGGMATHLESQQATTGLGFSSAMFDFTKGSQDLQVVNAQLEQPAIVSCKEPFLAAKQIFKWDVKDPSPKQLTSIVLPWHLNTAASDFTIGPNMLSYFDAAVIEFSSHIIVPETIGANGELIMVWDEGDYLSSGINLNQATLSALPSTRVSAFSLSQSKEVIALTFTPKGLGEYLPLDSGHEGAEIGSLRVFVYFPLVTESTVQSFDCSLYVFARVLATNIMQPPRQLAQVDFGMKASSTFFPVVPVNQLLLSTQLDSTMKEGSGYFITFSPSSVFMQFGIMQPSLLCNIASNCHWWKGDCVFELHVNRTAFHSGVLVVGFGSVNSTLKQAKEIFSLTHTVCNLKHSQTFLIRATFSSWNGKNFLSAGRKESLPRPDHKARQRIFIAISEPLQSTRPGLKTVGMTFTLKSIENCELGGSVPLKPLFGHVAKGSSGLDFFFSEASRFDAERQTNPATRDLAPLNGMEQEAQVQISPREKFTYFMAQYIFKPPSEGRVLVLPCAPWSFNFQKEESILAVITNPLVSMCSSFAYWRGALRYRLVFHKQHDFYGSTTVQVLLESTGFPKAPGFYKGELPLSAGGGSHWCFNLGPNSESFAFEVEDDEYFSRRYTRQRDLGTAVSRMSTLCDRHGNLVFYLPPAESYTYAELYISAGPDFNFSVSHPPVATTEKASGKMEGSVYKLLPAGTGVYEEVR
uniref:Polyprotein n=1 Tax=Sesamum torradovirus TaxID=3115803 RepID=A0AAT9JHC6_9SECO